MKKTQKKGKIREILETIAEAPLAILENIWDIFETLFELICDAFRFHIWPYVVMLVISICMVLGLFLSNHYEQHDLYFTDVGTISFPQFSSPIDRFEGMIEYNHYKKTGEPLKHIETNVLSALRILALEGDQVEVKDDLMYVNDEVYDDSSYMSDTEKFLITSVCGEFNYGDFQNLVDEDHTFMISEDPHSIIYVDSFVVGEIRNDHIYPEYRVPAYINSKNIRDRVLVVESGRPLRKLIFGRLKPPCFNYTHRFFSTTTFTEPKEVRVYEQYIKMHDYDNYQKPEKK